MALSSILLENVGPVAVVGCWCCMAWTARYKTDIVIAPAGVGA